MRRYGRSEGQIILRSILSFTCYSCQVQSYCYVCACVSAFYVSVCTCMRRVKYTHANHREHAPIKCIQLKIELEVVVIVVVKVEVIMCQESLFTIKYHTLSGGLDRALRAARAFTAKLPVGTVSSETSTSSLKKKKGGRRDIVKIMEQEHLIEWMTDRVTSA